MKKLLVASLAAFLGLPHPLQAQTYKCRQPDGSIAFQDRPCPAGATGSTVDLMPAQGYSSDDAARSLGAKVDQGAGRAARYPGSGGVDGANSQIEAANARIDVENRHIRCEQARHELGVLKEERPVYHYDNNGNKVYIEDTARPAALAAAQQRVSEACK